MTANKSLSRMETESIQDISFSTESLRESENVSQSIMSIKCLKKDIKAYQSKAENINALQNAGKDAKRSSFESGDNVDNVLSGESLFKTFTFEQTSEEDVVKCIAFWKSVMQKNLEPIKCSIIESSQTKAPGESEHKESLDISQQLYKTAMDTEEKVHKYYRNVWTTALQELQRKRLNEVKLIGKARCKMCESQISAGEDDMNIDDMDIAALNNWKPPKSKQQDLTNKSTNQKTTGGEESQISNKTVTCICKPSLQDTISGETVVLDRPRIPPNTNRYKLIDLIGEKRRSGTYSRWRKNITEPCTCGVDVCDCNLNPAIASWELQEEVCGCGQLECQCKIISEKLSEPDASDTEVVGKVAEKTDTDEECQCGNENCTCKLQSLKSQDVSSGSSPLFSDVTVEDPRLLDQSKDTLIVKLGETEPCYEGLYQTGAVKKSSQANVTNFIDIDSSHTTLVFSKIASDKQECLCKVEECDDCDKTKISQSIHFDN